jgi:DUF917 family protein
MKELTNELIPDLIVGSRIIGGGGGGDPYLLQLIAQRVICEYGPVHLWTMDEVPPDALVIAIALIGGTTVLSERLPNGNEAVQAVQSLEHYLRRQATALISIEGAGMNGVLPVIPAALLGLPLIDGDFTGRAIPGIHMTLPSIAGIRATPMVIVDSRGSRAVFDVQDDETAEIMARSTVVNMGGVALIALYPANAAQLKGSIIEGSISHMIEIGHVLNEIQNHFHDTTQLIRQTTGSEELFRGKVAEVCREWQNNYGYVRGDALIEGGGLYVGEEMSLKFQNEYLLAAVGRRLVLTVPDNIIVLEARTGFPIPPEFLISGMDLVILGIPAVEGWLTQKGLNVLGPRAFGYDVNYRRLLKARKNGH